ncbi:hypothetical protein pEaSNUABM29_00198 [Erwinia phage pEa_SNUABM_29]|nr:hypothetical protein pEaSNUABM29_00198 [Erwinia phage pEa_SNUABM_29]
MGETFSIQIPYNVMIINEDMLYQVNPAIKAMGGNIEFESIYAMALNTTTGKVRVEGKVKREDSRLDISDCEIKLDMKRAEFTGATTTHPRYIPLYTIAGCVHNVVEWSKARGILENGIWYTQGTKLYEEDGEAATGVGKSRHNDIMDGVGDALVVLVNLMELTGYEALEIACMVDGVRREEAPIGNAHYLFHKMRFHITNAIDYLWDEAGIDSPKKLDFKRFDNSVCTNIEYHYEEMIRYANALANAYDMTLEKCFSLAWDEIKDRKGFLNADGIFIKEADA